MSERIEKPKPHLSPSSLATACRCGEQFRRAYIEGDRLPPGIAQTKGTALHGAAAINFGQKIESHEDMPAAEITEAAVAAFDGAVNNEAIEFTDEENSRGSRVVLAEAKDAVADMATVHAASQAPDYQPVLVEEAVRIVVPHSSHDLFGYLDLFAHPADHLAGEPGALKPSYVVDIKTAGKKKTQEDVDGSVQLTTYHAALEILGLMPAEVRLDVLVKTKTKTTRQVLSSSRNAVDYASLQARFDSVVAMKEAGVFLPATPDAWWCSERFCGYHSTCKYVRRSSPLVTLDLGETK